MAKPKVKGRKTDPTAPWEKQAVPMQGVEAWGGDSLGAFFIHFPHIVFVSFSLIIIIFTVSF